MPQGFVKSLLWALALHGAVLGVLLLSWPFLAQSVFSFDRDKIIKVSLVSLDLSTPAPSRGNQETGSAAPFKKNNKNFPSQSQSNLKAPEPIPSTGDIQSRTIEDQPGNKEPEAGNSNSSQAGQSSIPSREKGIGGPGPSGGNGKGLLVSFPSAKGSGEGSSLAVPRYGQNREPHYPATAREQGWQGTALLKVLVLKNGTVGSLEILRSSGYAVLDRSALKAVKEWKFIPAHKDGQPIDLGVEIPVTFRLE